MFTAASAVAESGTGTAGAITFRPPIHLPQFLTALSTSVSDMTGQKGRRVGYTRVSTADLNTARQLDGVDEQGGLAPLTGLETEQS